MNSLPPELLCRIIGTLGGAGMALATNWPGTWPNAAKRIFVSIVSGMAFADVLGEDWLGWSMIVPNRIIAASCLSAFLGWWVMNGLIRLAQNGFIPGLGGK